MEGKVEGVAGEVGESGEAVADGVVETPAGKASRNRHDRAEELRARVESRGFNPNSIKRKAGMDP